jgi:hypothetical protein
MGAFIPWIVRGLSALGLVQIGQNMTSDDESTGSSGGSGAGLLTTIGAITFAGLVLFVIYLFAAGKIKK